ncbi:hypothetical protein ACFL3T_00515 [Patescibacteria group bacterium]
MDENDNYGLPEGAVSADVPVDLEYVEPLVLRDEVGKKVEEVRTDVWNELKLLPERLQAAQGDIDLVNTLILELCYTYGLPVDIGGARLSLIKRKHLEGVIYECVTDDDHFVVTLYCGVEIATYTLYQHSPDSNNDIILAKGCFPGMSEAICELNQQKITEIKVAFEKAGFVRDEAYDHKKNIHMQRKSWRKIKGGLILEIEDNKTPLELCLRINTENSSKLEEFRVEISNILKNVGYSIGSSRGNGPYLLRVDVK